MQLPTGTVTFLLTDIEGSTKLWQWHEDVMGRVVARHDEIVAKSVADHGGVFVKAKGEGDSTFSVFTKPSDAVVAAVDALRALRAEPWHADIDLKARAAVHTGEAELREGDYYGTTVNRCARLRSAAHGGQVICSQAIEELAGESMPAGITLRDLGTHRLKDLTRPERIFQLCHADLPSEFPPLRSLNAYLNNLPMQRTTFIGREDELEQLRGMLADHRLVTLTGVGGCGKTRLGLQAAADELDRFPDGVFFVDLAPVTDPSVLPSAAANAVGLSTNAITGGSGRSIMDDLVDFLAAGTALVVLDNCEHLVDACSDLADVLVERCPDLTILATSRETLGVAGEQTYAVPSLSVPKEDEAEGDCVALFCDRAASVRPGFGLTAENGKAVAEICRRLDGIPLAIELAAAQVPHLSPQQIAERLNDRFKLLTGPRRRVQRQQTLAAALDWSYELLEGTERLLLTRLAVFPGSFTLEAAEAVCSSQDIDRPVVSLLRSLVAKSMVMTEESRDHLRYRLLETVRLYAEEKLLASGEADAFRTTHRDYYLGWIEALPPDKMVALGRPVILPEHHNVRAALGWCEAEGRYDLLARVASRAGEMWSLAFADEGARWLDLVFEHRDGIDREVLSHCFAVASWVANTRMDGSTMVRSAQEVIALTPDELSIWTVIAYSLLAVWTSGSALTGDPDEIRRVRELGQRSIAIEQSLDVPVYVAPAIYGMVLAMLGDLEESVECLLRSEVVRPTDTGDLWPAFPASRRCLVLHMLGRHAESLEAGRRASEMYERAVAENTDLFWQVDPGWRTWHLAPYALALCASGRDADARAHMELALQDRRRIRIPGFIGEVFVILAVAATLKADWERASVLLAVAFRETANRSPVSIALYRRVADQLRSSLDAATTARCRERGAAMPVEKAIELGLDGLHPAPVA